MNNNTKRLIQTREWDAFVDRKDSFIDNVASADINDQYIVHLNIKPQNDLEMKHMEENN